MYSTPTPFGPRNLCAARLSRSTPSGTVILSEFGACTASVWNGIRRLSAAARARTAAEISSIGWIVPTSLFAVMTLTSTVASVIAVATSSAETSPKRSTGTYVISKPNRSRYWHACSTA